MAILANSHPAKKWLAGIRERLSADADRSGWSETVKVVLGPVIVLVLVIVGVWALKEIPRWQVNELVNLTLRMDEARRFELENEARKTLTQIVLGVFGLIALFLAWQRVRANDRNVRVIEQGHITERYTQGIEQLGKFEADQPNIEVRLGGIYALERIAIDSVRDHWTIMEVLTAYVRRNAPAPPPNPELISPISEKTHQQQKPRADIQAILTVLGRRRHSRKRERAPDWLNLRETDLRGANLWGAHLEGANLGRAHLEGANLGRAHLQLVLGLTVEQVKASKNWDTAHYDDEFREKLFLSGGT